MRTGTPEVESGLHINVKRREARRMRDLKIAFVHNFCSHYTQRAFELLALVGHKDNLFDKEFSS